MRRKQDGSRKSDIADAILKIAGREGIGALTMERLARELGVTSGALFRHFPTRGPRPPAEPLADEGAKP